MRRSAGHPLDAATRAFFEPHFGRDFSGVRIHTNEAAAASARSIKAHAYAAGDDLVFDTGRFAPDTEQGRRLLAHELTHVAQKADGIQRQSDDDDDDGIGANAYDPCTVQVPSLTNGELVAELKRARDYLLARKRGEDDYYAYANLMHRLVDERHARMRSGHVWLGEDLDAMPSVLYRLSTGDFGAIEVMPQDVDAERGVPKASLSDESIVTSTQFHAFLTSQNIPTIDPAEFFAKKGGNNGEPLRVLPPLPPDMSVPLPGMDLNGPIDLNGPVDLNGPANSSSPVFSTLGIAGGGTYISPFDLFSRGQISGQVFSPNVNMNNPRSVAGARSNWRGALPEAEFASRGYGLGYQNLNNIQDNFPIFDFRPRMSSTLISVKSVVPTTPGGTPDFTTYINGFDDMAGVRRPATMTRAVNALNAASGTQFTAADLIGQAQLAVNIDHLEGARNAIEARVRANPGDYAELFNSFMQESPVLINGVQYRTFADLQTARTNGTLQQADLDSAFDTLARRARSRVITNGFTTEELRNMQNFRESFQNLPGDEFNRLAAPELIEAERFGGGWEGTRAAMGQSMLRGGGQGMVLSAGFDLARAAFDPEARARLPRQLLTDVPLGGFGGITSSAIESSLNMSISRSMLTEAGTGGASAIPGALPLLGRGLSGGVAGGITAPIVTMLAMGLDSEHEYTGIDYAAKGTRAFVSGSIAGGGGALAAGLVGGLAGSEVPLLGNAVGFVVGIGVYYISDWLLGDSVEREVRLEMGEGGCPRPEPDLDASGGYE
jgi:hypothetical protein